MYQAFDYYSQYEKPDLVLCNPNRTQLYSLNMAREVRLSIKYNALSELKFIIDASSDNGETTNPSYDYVQSKRLVYVSGTGYFIISGYVEDTSGFIPFKEVEALSLESELINKRLAYFEGTYKFYDPISPEDTLIQKMLDLAPSWSVGTIDSLLWNKYRTFDISNSNIYNFLMTEVETSYGCIFTFDTVNRTISATHTSNATTSTDVFISKENLIESASLTEISKEIVTALSVYGGGDLDIRRVNPLGSNYIYDFSYYKTTEWMSQDLVDAITAWEDMVELAQPIFSIYTTRLFEEYQNLETLNGELSTLEINYAALETELKARVEGNLPLGDIKQQMNELETQIESKTEEISLKEAEIYQIINEMSQLSETLSFEINFSQSQLSELQNYIIENTYQNKNIIITDVMTESEKMQQAQELYDDGASVLENAARPRYEFSITTANFVFLPEFESFTDELDLGSTVTINTKDDLLVQSVLLEINLNFNDPTDFSLVFSNRLRLDDGSFIYSDLFNQQAKASGSVDFKGLGWSNWEKNYKDDVSTFITSALDATTNNLISNSNQEIVINQNGLKGRQYLPETDEYSDKQVWLTSSVLAFTRDNWDTSALAIGNITFNDSEVYGLVADAIVGRMIAGNQLSISNEGNNFVLDSSGATLSNASFTLQDSGNKVRIAISPVSSTFGDITIDPGITVIGNEGGNWSKRFWVDSSGNVNLTGKVIATSGSIGGIGLNTSIPGVAGKGGIYSTAAPKKYYIASNGDLVWGNLSIIGDTATFKGAIEATTLSGTIDWSNVTNVPANVIEYGGAAGFLSGSGIYGGTISGLAGSIKLDGTGGGTILELTGAIISLKGGGTSVLFTTNIMTASGYDVSFTNGSTLKLNGSSVATQSWVTSQGFLTINTAYRNYNYIVWERTGNSTWTFDYGRVKSITYSSI